MSSIKQIVFRGDQACYHQVEGKFPYIDHAAAAGATGVLIWFWTAPFEEVAEEFIAYCKERNVGVHLGIGIGAYGVCDGQDPLDPTTMGKIKRHIDRTLNNYDLAGVEYQTGEYDLVEFKGKNVEDKSHAQQICETLNPYIDYILKRKPSLWLRTELNAEFCPENQLADVAKMLDSRCTVEWSRFTGPYNGADCHERGRKLLQLANNFSWFLKIMFRRDYYWKELIKGNTPNQKRQWIEHWRGWVKPLADLKRTTLTICNVDDAYPHSAMPLPAAAVALARNPDLSAEEVMARFFAG
jgi:hypothetical protein